MYRKVMVRAKIIGAIATVVATPLSLALLIRQEKSDIPSHPFPQKHGKGWGAHTVFSCRIINRRFRVGNAELRVELGGNDLWGWLTGFGQ
jgi:hypothetical protein